MRLAIALILLAAPGLAQESTAPIRLALTDRTAQQLATQIMGRVLTEAGYGVEFVATTTIAQFDALVAGDIELAMHVPEGAGLGAMHAGVDAGTIDIISPTGLSGIEDWWIPAHMLAACPYLPDIAELLDPACLTHFGPDGLARLVTGPDHWGGRDLARITAMGLPFQIEQVATEAELWAALDAAIAEGAPIILPIPQAHWTGQTLDGAYLSMPLWEPACDADPAWGANPDATGDCALPMGSTWNIAWAGFDDNWPGAAATVSAFFMTSADMAALTAQVDREGQTIDAVVDGWMAANGDIWRLWAGL